MKLQFNVPVSGLDLAGLLQGEEGLFLCQNKGQDYIAVECRMPLRTAQHYMYLAKHEEKLRQLVGPDAQGTAFLSQAQALKLLGAAKKKRKRAVRAVR